MLFRRSIDRFRPANRSSARRAVVASVLALALATVALPLAATPSSASLLGGLLGGTSAPYVVTDLDSVSASLISQLVDSVGGVVVSSLGVVGAISAGLDGLEVSLLDAIPGVVVTPDVTVAIQGTESTSTPSRTPAAVFPEQTGADQLWSAGDTGAGVNVAVLDTGIDPLPDFAGRLVGGVDLTGGNNPFEDQYGHGTFVAGLIAGNGVSSGGSYLGEAPGAGLVSVKVAGASGVTDLATVIEGVGWTIANAARLHIRVLNMSLGFIPFQSTTIDPLDQAVQAAWDAGIVVVVSAGNSGPSKGTILSPGDDPDVITVGAVDDLGQTNPADDVMTSFSSVGTTNPDGWFKPDLVTSGRSVVSLAAPGSTVDEEYPSARIGDANFVGSGTSFSSAITAGAAALILAANPGESPDAVKASMLATTSPGPVGNPFVDGHGDLDVAAAAADSTLNLNQSFNDLPAIFPGSTVELSKTWQQSSWNPANWSGTLPSTAELAELGAAGNSGATTSVAWNGSTWNSVAWNGEAWESVAWDSVAWNGEARDSVAWNGEDWESVAWNGSSWS